MLKLILLFVFALAGALYGRTLHLTRQTNEAYPPVGDFAEIGDVRLHYTDYPAEGDADLPPLLFIHGASGNLREQQGVLLDKLRGRARLIFVDRPGHGHSTRGGAADMHLPSGQARILSGLLGKLGIDRAIVIGHSYGASVAASLAVEHPGQVAGLVFLAPATHPWPGGGVTWYYDVTALPVIGYLFSELIAVPAGHLRYRKGVGEIFAPEKTPPRYAEISATQLVLRPQTFRNNAADVTSLYGFVRAFSQRYREIAVPTSILSGDSDDVVLAHIHSEGLARDIEGSKLVWLEGVGHAPAWTRPDAVIAEIERVAGEIRP
ncbi:MAG: alpha/beta hydrolase [Nitratireductor sp.]|nr:alpha/beta hydrolase [Nitratireductor sp.]